MKKAKKFLISLLAFASVSAFALNSFACDNKYVGTGGTNNGLGGLGGLGGTTHTHVYDQEIIETKYAKTAADCYNGGIYYKSCTCGTKGTETFSVGALGHTGDYCTRCKKDVTSKGLEYKLSDDGTYYIVSRGNFHGTDLYIPSKYNNIPVKEIGKRAFYNWSMDNYTAIHNITIPNSITVIGESAFANCHELTSITLPSSVNIIDREAFAYCSNLIQINIPSSVTTINYGAFSSCTSLKNITIPNSIKEIKIDTFNNCSSLTDISLPNSLIRIGSRAFSRCTSLTTFTIPDSVTTIDSDAFSNCENLTDLIMGTSVTNISIATIKNCPNLNFSIYNNVKYLGTSNNPYYACIQFVTNDCNDYTLHPQTKIVCDEAFSNCDNLLNMTISDKVVSLGAGAFHSCDNLVNVTIGNGVTVIQSNTFDNCNSLETVTLGDSVTTIDDRAFRSCDNLINVAIPESLINIGMFAFNGCDKLECNIYNNAKYLGSTNNPYLALIGTVDDTYSSYQIHPQTKVISGSAFHSCKNLTSITIPNSVKTIGSTAFYNCENLTYVIIGNSVTAIEDSAFNGCSNLTSVTIPSSVTTIGDWAFKGCTNLTTMTFSDTSTWYYTDDYEDWKQKIDGTQINLSNSAENPVYFTGTDFNDNDYYWAYWYKL